MYFLISAYFYFLIFCIFYVFSNQFNKELDVYPFKPKNEY